MRVRIGSEVVKVEMKNVIVDRKGVSLQGGGVSIDLSADEMTEVIRKIFSGDDNTTPIFKVRLVRR